MRPICATCPAELTKTDVNWGCTRCRPCRREKPQASRRINRVNMSTTPCATCPTLLSRKEVKSGCVRCGRCRYNCHGVKPKKVAAPPSDSWWQQAPRDGFTQQCLARFPTDIGIVMQHKGRFGDAA